MHQLLPAAIAAALLSSPIAAVAAPPPSCTADHQPASIVRTAYAEYPPLAQLERVTGTSVVRVDLSENGSVRSSSIALSSGSAILDQAAVKAAQALKFSPETHDCQAIAGSYAVQVEFTD